MLRLHRALRPLSLPRLLMLALLVLGVLSKPVLASIGEIHELQHDPSGQHLLLESDDGHLPVVGADTLGDATADDGDGLIHELLHFAHCCGQSPQSVPAMAMTVPAPAIATNPPAPAAVPAPRHRCQDVFRPPIAA